MSEKKPPPIIQAVDENTATPGVVARDYVLSPSGQSKFSAPENVELGSLRIGNYYLHRTIGAGGSGVIYEALQDRPNRLVALKLLRHAVMTVEQLRRFERESELLGGLSHPNIAQVYEAGTHREGSISVPYYVMELVGSAKSITQYANTHNISRQNRLRLMLQACAAVQYAHDRGILHRDIKPSNILVDESGTVKLIDLGVSRLLGADFITLTNEDQLIGTMAYMAPEQISGERVLPSTSWDIYGLGVILCELVLGRYPYGQLPDNPIRAIHALMQRAPILPRSIDKSISRDLEIVMLKAIAQDPSTRYNTVSEFAADLRAVLNEQPIRATHRPLRVGVFRNVAKWAAGRQASVAIIGVLFCVVATEWSSSALNSNGATELWEKMLATMVGHSPGVTSEQTARAIAFGGMSITKGGLMHLALFATSAIAALSKRSNVYVRSLQMGICAIAFVAEAILYRYGERLEIPIVAPIVISIGLFIMLRIYKRILVSPGEMPR